ncbi:hypothetical protein I79_008151 [Cricetulus griseus]|uniref:Uncharacterized protein n=1 Tax=Cricetulus griseus TaxID=10029 RepID=G3HCE2_CRIGR|nr:hypothetical protein I79_008151 [Cricetulus griseus]
MSTHQPYAVPECSSFHGQVGDRHRCYYSMCRKRVQGGMKFYFTHMQETGNPQSKWASGRDFLGIDRRDSIEA